MLQDKINFGMDMESPTNLFGTLQSVADLITNKGQVTPPLIPALVHPGHKYTSSHNMLKTPLTFTHMTTVTYLSQVPGAGDMTLKKVITNVLTQSHSLQVPLLPPSVTAKVTPVIPSIGNTVVTTVGVVIRDPSWLVLPPTLLLHSCV